MRFTYCCLLLCSVLIINNSVDVVSAKKRKGAGGHQYHPFMKNNLKQQQSAAGKGIITATKTRSPFVEHLAPYDNKDQLGSKTFEQNGNLLSIILSCAHRGGACNDSNPSLFLKIALSASLETAAMVGLIVLSYVAAEKFPDIFPSVSGLPITTWLSLFAIIFASSVLAAFVEGGLSAASSQVLDPNEVPGDINWYAQLKKPFWTPPGFIFPIMWLIVSKPTQLLAVSKLLKSTMQAVVTDDGEEKSRLPIPLLIVYCAHLSLGDAWNKIFFGLQCTGRGAAVITLFLGMLLSSAYLFYQADHTAGLLLLPTCGWVLVATALNWNIYLANKK